MNPIKTLLKSSRLPFLLLTPVCVLLGIGSALAEQPGIDILLLFLILLGALSAHVSVNMLNEYHDCHSGLDSKTVKTPFSGGSGALQLRPEMAEVILVAGLLFLFVTLGVGLVLFILQGPLILPVGLLGVVIIVTYTKWINRSPLLCLIAPGLAFGPLMVIGAHVALTGRFSFLASWVSMVPFFLVNNLLLLNQIPDIEADASVGRRTFPIVYGRKRSAFVYALFALCAFAAIPWGVIQGDLSMSCLLAMLPGVLVLSAFYGLVRYGENIPRLIPFMAYNVAGTILTPLLLGFAMIF